MSVAAAAYEPSPPAFLSGGGELGERMRAFDWAKTPLGAASSWPQSLKTTVRIMLTSRQPMFIWWGDKLINLYNDAYKAIVGGKHPGALGQPAQVVWSEIWDQVGPRAESAMKRNEGTYDEALLLIMERYGYPEETYYTFSYSPVPNDQGGTGGIVCANTDDTRRIIGERQLALLRELAAGTADARNVEEACRLAALSLHTNRRDLPFALLYLFDDERRSAVLWGTSGIAPGHIVSPERVGVHDSAIWSFAQLLQARDRPVNTDIKADPRTLPKGEWDRSPARAVLLPIISPGQRGRSGVLVAGLSPYRLFDDNYRGFMGLVAGQIAAAIANAQAYDEERRRAEALAEIDRAKTAFFSNASHEFRTPLTLMLSPLEEILVRSVRSGAVTADRREIEIVHRNGLRLLKLVNTLLDFSRIEAGRIEAIYEPVDLATFTNELPSNFHSAMEKAGLRYVVDCPPLDELVYVDRDMWEKIVLNLISNAFKYTLNGEVAVVLHSAPDGTGVELNVRDTGVGIPAHELPHLFERFHRIEGQLGRTHEGTGIGLALVQELARLHGGAVTAQSTLGRGSSFTVLIPLGRDHLPADRIGAARTLSSTSLRAGAFVGEALRWLPGRADDGGITIENELIGIEPYSAPGSDRAEVLLADDNADMRDYVRQLLSTRYRVEAVPDGQAALEAASRRRPDLILTDVMMPRLNGFGLLRALRADPELRDVPVLLLSARAGEEASIEGLEAGADDYLAKPFSARELLARVRANLELARARRQVAQELRDLNETLEQRVAQEINERMKTEEALRQAQKMEAIGQLTGGVAHDFNNLLQVILGNLEVLQRRFSTSSQGDFEEVQRLTAAAIRGGQRAATLTQRLLAFSRRQPLQPRPLDVNRLVVGMSELLRRTLGESITIETVLAGGLWLISADANELESALLNLAVNSRDAMPNGGKLTIETGNFYLDETYAHAHEEVVAGQYVMIAISDTGTGMSKEVRSKAFQPFFTTKQLGQGTGLGLSQVYGFVKQSGGHINIYSEPGEGTTVRLYLPRLVAGQADDEDGAKTLYVPTGSKREIIFVVEDDDDVRANSVAMLRELGYDVLEARDGATALRTLVNNPNVCLLFTDVGLPGGFNGRQLADEARLQLPGLKVLFTTGYARNAIVHQGRLDPGVELIVKPFTYIALATKIRRLLENEPRENGN